MTLEEMLKLLGITEKDASVLRLVDGVVPSVDFVDLGANGTGERGFLVKKGKKMPKPSIGQLTVDENGNYVLKAPVAKGADEETPAAKLSASNKAALAELVSAQEAKLEELKKALDESEEDDSAEDMPETIKTILAGLAKGLTIEEPAAEVDADEPAAEAEPAAEPTAKAAEGEPAAEADADDGTFEIGDLVLTGNLASIAKGMADAAGDSMDADEFATTFGALAQLQAKLNPSAATAQAVAGVSKRMDKELGELKADNVKLKAQVDALVAAAGAMGPGIVPDGTPQPAPTKKKKGPQPIPCGQPIGNYIGEAGKTSFTTER